MFNDKVKLDHSLEFASVLKALGRVRGALFIQKKKQNKTKKTSTRVKSQFAWKVYFIEENPGYSLRFVWFSQIVSLLCKLNLQEPC